MGYDIKEFFKNEIYSIEDIDFINDKVKDFEWKSFYRDRMEKIEDRIDNIQIDIDKIKSQYIIDLFEKYDECIGHMTNEQNCVAYYVGMQRVLKDNDMSKFYRETLFNINDIKYVEKRIMPNILKDKELIKINEKIGEIYNKEINKLFEKYKKLVIKRLLVENCLSYYLGINMCLRIKDTKNFVIE